MSASDPDSNMSAAEVVYDVWCLKPPENAAPILG